MAKPISSVSDTDPISASVRANVLRKMDPRRKVELIEDANRTSRLLALAGIAARHPDLTIKDQQRILMDLVLGKDLARQAYGPSPDLKNR